MERNVGGLDRTGRVIAGVILLLIGLLAPLNTVWQVIVLILAAVALITAIVGFCPGNALLGINTRRGHHGR